MSIFEIRFRMALHEVLYQEASYLLKEHNPCQMHKGKCLRSIGPCCDRCKYLGDKGCTVKALYCKVWLCYEARQNNPKLAEKLNDLTEIADKYGLLMIRSSEQDVQRRFEGGRYHV